MKKLILASLALLLVFAVVPAMAGEKSSNGQDPAVFQALSKLSVPGQMALNVMTDEQLAAVEGQRSRRSRVVIKNTQIARIFQNNTAVCLALCGVQSNVAGISQSID